MKIGITYLFTISKYGYPPTLEGDLQSIRQISEMGFHFLEMEGLGVEHAKRVLANKETFRRELAANNVHIHNFCVVDPMLTSVNREDRLKAYEHFKRMIEVGVELGAETIHLASYAPPVDYVGSRPYQLGSDYEIKDIYRAHIPEGFRWSAVWDALVESSRFAAEYVKQYSKTVLMEPRVGETVCSVDSLVRLIDDVGMDNFKANFDVGHFAAQREDASLALFKLEGKFANIHIADNIPTSTTHLPVGDGVIDWEEFFRNLKRMNYGGYLGLDLTNSPTLENDFMRSAAYIKNVCEKLGIPIEM